MEIPHQQLAPETLQSLIEEFIFLEGTDYGEYEVSREQKIQQIIRQLDKGDVVILFDSDSESCNIVRKSEVRKSEVENVTNGL